MSQHTYGMECTPDDPCMACCADKAEERADRSIDPLELGRALQSNDSYTWYDVGGRFTCSEADELVDLLRTIGRDDLADSLAEGHADEDDEGDDHYRAEVEA